jgi:hypothetical protein
MSVHQYDKLKNCTPNLSERPNSIEYLTYFNCGHISEGNGTTLRDFTLIIEENQKIPVSNEGHIFNGGTFNGTIPGPTTCPFATSSFYPCSDNGWGIDGWL